MNWYLAKIVYRVVCGEGNHTPQFDEQLRLILAVDTAAAYQKAKAIGESEQTDFSNQNKSLVRWQFINIAELFQMDSAMDGAELYSNISEISDANYYIKNIHDQSAQLLQPDRQFFMPSA